jgi:hypothetical protein
LYLKELEDWLNRWRLKAASHKCTYILVEGKKSNLKLKLKLYNNELRCASDQPFLGIQFDRLLNFNHHIDNIINRANKRLNIIKILANPAWKLNKSTLVNIYKTIMRSIIDYSAILIPHLTQAQINKLQATQNKALRLIYNREESVSLDQLHLMARLENIKIRFYNLTKNYLIKALNSNNPIISDLVKEFRRYSNGRILDHQTLLCPFKADLEEAMNALNEPAMSEDNC